MHLDEERVQRWVDGELSPEEERAVRDHLASCAECGRRVAAAEGEVAQIVDLLRALDDRAPGQIRAETIAERARGWDAAWMRKAAAVALVAGLAGAAYALPGSPVRAWIGALAERIAARPEPPRETPLGRRPEPTAGIAVPAGQTLLVSFTSRQEGGRLVVSLIDRKEVEVLAPAGAATFESAGDELTVRNRGEAADFEISIPRAAPRVEIRVGGDRIFLKEGLRVTTLGTPAGDDRYLLLLSPSSP